MDRVHADGELKTHTKETVMEVLSSTAPQAAGGRRRKYSKVKRMGVAIAAAAACMVVAAAGYAYYETPVDYVSLDINPSVELGVNAFDKVVRAEGINQDGVDLIGNLNLHNMSVQDAVRMLVSQACTQGYIAPDGSSVIALTGQSAVAEQALELSEQSEQGAQAALQEQNAVAVLYGDTTDLAIRHAAQQMGVSTGKYKLMMALSAMDPSLEIGQFKNATVSQIMLRSAEMPDGAGQGGEFAETLQKMQQAADQIQQRAGIMQQDQTQEQVQTQEQIQEKEQDQTQEQIQEQTQSQDGAQESCQPTGYAEQNSNEGEGESQEQEQNESTSSPAASPSANGSSQNGQSAGQGSGDGSGNGKS